VYIDPYTLQGVSHKASSSLSPAMSKYAQYLRVCYSRTSLPENNKFPPSPSVHYINLAYTLRRTVSKHESDQFKVAMVRGEIDKIARDKGLDFNHIAERLPDGSYPQVVLVEGAPGVGKTTFAWEFCKKWGKGELKPEYSLVILLRLRDKRMQEAKCLRDLFYHPDETLPDVIAAELINSWGEGVLVFLEGLDELPEHQRTESSVFLDLIHGRLLPLATVLITTRPWASEYLHRSCKEKISQHVEILGFTKQQIQNYLRSVCKPDDDPSLLSDIEKYLSCYPQIHAAMYIPLNAAIVVRVYRRSRIGECIVPKTMTQLYTALSQTLLIRYLEEHPVHRKTKWEIHNFSDLPSDVYEHFLQLSELAFDSIKNNQKLIFSSKDIPDNLETLGFMQSVPELYVNESFSHNFLHLTIQEYLAAVYITRLSPEEQLEHYRECGDGLLKVVMTFVAGLTKFSGIPSDSVRNLFLMPPNDPNPPYHVKCDNTMDTHHVDWMFETQDPNTLNDILGSGNTIEFICENLMPFDYYCLGYCIAHSHCQWKLLFDGEDMVNVNMLTAGGSAVPLSKQNSFIVSMNLEESTPELMEYLFNTLLLHIRVELQELIGYTCDPLSLTKIVRLSPSLKVLELTWTKFTVRDLRELCDLLVSTSNSLEIIKVRAPNDGETSSMTIEGRYRLTSVSVDIVISNVDDVTNVVSVLTENSNVGLHITAIRMHMDSGQTCQIAKSLHGTTTLKVLNVYDETDPNGIKDVLAIAKLINNNKSLEVVEVMLGSLVFSLKELYRLYAITVGEFRELCDHLLALTSNSLESIKIGKYFGGDQSHMTIEGRYQLTSVSVDIVISSVDDVINVVSVLTENSNVGLHITAIKIIMSMDSGQTCQIAKALHNITTLKKLVLLSPGINLIEMEGVLAIAKLINNNKSLEYVCVMSGSLHFSLRELSWRCKITVGDFRELCDDLLASISNSLENIKTRKYYDGHQSYMTIEGRYQLTSVSVNIVISSVEDVTSTVSVLTENSNLGLHITAVRIGELYECIDGGDLACQLAETLHDAATLKTWVLIDQPIGTKGAIAIANLLHNSKSLEKVNISNCGLDCEKVCHLAQALCESTTMRGLNLSSNPIGTKGAMAIANLLHSSKSLEKVNISNCGLDCEKVCHLAQALCESTTLRGLNLSSNPIGTKGAMILAVLIHSNKSLEEVNVRNCDIGSDGACHLACSWELCVNTSLIKLDLSRNPIGTKGAIALAEVIRTNNSLKEVIINFDGEGAYHLAGALCENTALRKLDLSYSPSRHERATAEVKAKLFEAQRVNSTLQILALPGEKFSFPNIPPLLVSKRPVCT